MIDEYVLRQTNILKQNIADFESGSVDLERLLYVLKGICALEQMRAFAVLVWDDIVDLMMTETYIIQNDTTEGEAFPAIKSRIASISQKMNAYLAEQRVEEIQPPNREPC